MKIGSFAMAAVALGIAFAPGPAQAQGPTYDKVQVNLPYSVSVGDRTLPPGDYVIQQLQTNDNSRVLLFYSDNGTRFETSATTIAALDPLTPPDETKIVLHHYGPDYYFDKIWIQGKNYGYEFPVPARVRERQQERQTVTVAGQYQPAQPVNTAQNTPPPEQAAPAPEPEPQPAPEVAQNAPPPPPQPEAAPPPPPPAQENANRQMPATSAGWLMMLLGGGALSGLGMALRRKA